MTADEILSIKSPTKLFSGNSAENSKLYKELARQFHPDFNNTADVFAHINDLYRRVKNFTPNILKVDGIEYTYQISRDFELGKVFISDEAIIYQIDDDHIDILRGYDYSKFIKPIDGQVMKRFEKSLPIKYRKIGNCLIIEKTYRWLCLYDVFVHYNGRIPGRHLCWIISGLQDFAVYLNFIGVSHQDISLHNCYINPKTHEVGLLGAWWYATSINSKITDIPTRTYENLPFTVKSSKKASYLTDLQLVRTLGLEMMGGKYDSFPKELSERFESVVTCSPLDDYIEWGKLLDKLGKRVFVKMGLTAKDIYI